MYKQQSCNYHCKTISGLWGHNTVKKILTNKVYTGDLIQHQGEMVSYKVKKYRLLPKSEHLVKEKAHEPIIDNQTYELAQDILKRKAHNIHRKGNSEHLLAGLLYCPRCNNKYTYQVQRGLKNDMVAICSMYNRYGKDYCTRIAVRESVLNEFVVQDLRKILQEKIDKEKLIKSIDKTKINNDKKMLQKKIADNNRRIEEIAKIIKTAYEDRVNGLLDTEEFVSFTESYKKEKQELIEKTEKLNIKLSNFENNKENEVLEEEKGKKEQAKLEEIKELVIDGEDEEIVDKIKEAIDAGVSVGDIVNNGLIEAMNVIGPMMASGELFVPEVLMSAETMQVGLNYVKPLLQDGDLKSLGTVVIGTVEGDLHDIGKNLVAMMLESSGFTVINIGIDQSPQAFVDAIVENNAQIVGLSALLTTTMPAMRDTVALIKEKGLDVKVAVGGAPVNKEFADSIGADGYSEDATGAVALCKGFVGA